jgi:hypothetical protein
MKEDWLITTKVFNRITLRRVEAIEKLVNEGEEGLALDKLRELRNSLEARVKVVPMKMEGSK